MRSLFELLSFIDSFIAEIESWWQFRAERMDTVGPIALAELEQMRGFVSFIGADGLSMEFGPSAVDMESAWLARGAGARPLAVLP